MVPVNPEGRRRRAARYAPPVSVQFVAHGMRPKLYFPTCATVLLFVIRPFWLTSCQSLSGPSKSSESVGGIRVGAGTKCARYSPTPRSNELNCGPPTRTFCFISTCRFVGRCVVAFLVQ